MRMLERSAPTVKGRQASWRRHYKLATWRANGMPTPEARCQRRYFGVCSLARACRKLRMRSWAKASSIHGSP